MFVIERDSVPSIHHVEIDGQQVSLGTLKDLRKIPDFRSHVPEYARFSMSWVHLAPLERLEEHRHPTTSIIIVTEGIGEVSGDVEGTIRTGDVVLVPPGALHGFVGRGTEGFWGLSIQLEGNGLYEDLSNPRVQFEQHAISGTEGKLKTLLARNDRFLGDYRNNPLVRLVQSDRMKDQKIRGRLLDCLQYWSDSFQQVLCARAALETQDAFRKVAEAHIREELGHNEALREMRGEQASSVWDPILAAASSWFIGSMPGLSSEERVILVHFVLEGSGEVFHEAALKAFPASKHFTLHSVVDESHYQMGIDVLRAQTNLDSAKLHETLHRGWMMMELLSRRMAELSTERA